MNALTKILGQLECWRHKRHVWGRAIQEISGYDADYVYRKTCTRCGLVRAVKRRVRK